MEENEVVVIVVIAVPEMLVKSVLGVEPLFFEQGRFILDAHFAQEPVVFLFQMSF